MLNPTIGVIDATVDEVDAIVKTILVDSNMVDSDLVNALYRDLVGTHLLWLIFILVDSKEVNARKADLNKSMQSSRSKAFN